MQESDKCGAFYLLTFRPGVFPNMALIVWQFRAVFKSLFDGGTRISGLCTKKLLENGNIRINQKSGSSDAGFSRVYCNLVHNAASP